MINAADYTTWRNAMAAGSAALINDPTPGAVDATDYTYWKSHFGATIGAASSTVVPDPATWLLTICSAPLGYRFRRARMAPKAAPASAKAIVAGSGTFGTAVIVTTTFVG